MTNYGYLKDKDGNRLAIEDAYGYMKTSGDQTLSGSMTITGNLRLKGSSNYGNKLSFGDSDYVYLSEPSDDLLEIHASKGIILGEYSTSEKAVGKWIDGKTVYRQVETFTSVGTLNFNVSIDTLVYAYCIVHQSGVEDSSWRTVPWLFNGVFSSQGWAGGFFVKGNGETVFQIGEHLGHITYGHVIIEYTKK